LLRTRREWPKERRCPPHAPPGREAAKRNALLREIRVLLEEEERPIRLHRTSASFIEREIRSHHVELAVE
jgi:hypothetical protein